MEQSNTSHGEWLWNSLRLCLQIKRSWLAYARLDRFKKWIAETKYIWKSGVFKLLTPSPGPLPSPAMELRGEDGREVWEADGDLTGAGEEDMSNYSSWWDDASSDGRCGGVGLGGAFFLEEDFFAGFLGDFFPMPRPRPLPAIRRIWWDWSKGMISICNNAAVYCRDTVEEWWERRLPASLYTLWIDVMRSPTKR